MLPLKFTLSRIEPVMHIAYFGSKCLFWSYAMRYALSRMRFSKYRTAFEKEKELTDRALKLAEVVKPKSN